MNFFKTSKRIKQVVTVFMRHGFGGVIDQMHLGKYIPFMHRLRSMGQWPPVRTLSVPARLREAFEELGPTFVKFAQVLSARPDMITPGYAEEFKKLQDSVPPFPTEQARAIIEEELGVPFDTVFAEFGPPVAAASIAQVHKARLKDGRTVAVKIQRPGIAEQLEVDGEILAAIAEQLEQHVPESRFFNPVAMVNEFKRTVKKELLFTEEARNLCRFRRNFKGVEQVHFPEVVQDFTTERVLLMQWIEGERIDKVRVDAACPTPEMKALAGVGLNAYFKMVFEDGFFHADPHPGNILVMPDGRVCFLDFGIVGRVSDELKSTLAHTLTAIVSRDYDHLIDKYIELGIVPSDVEPEEFRREFKSDLVDFMEPFYGRSLREMGLEQYLDMLMHLAMKHHLRVPQELMLINRALLILHDIGMTLDPDFDLVKTAEPYVSKLVMTQVDPKRMIGRMAKEFAEAGDFVMTLPKTLRSLLKKTMRGELRLKMSHEGLDHLIQDMDRSSNRIAFALVISAMLISSAIMHAFDVGPAIYGISVLGMFTFGFAAVMGVWLIISIMRSGRM